MHLESVDELREDFVFGLLSGLDVWVLFTVVDTLNVVKFNHAILILVENLEGLLDKDLSEFVHFTSDDSEEFVVVDGAVTIAIEDVEQASCFFLIESNPEIFDSFPKFLNLQYAVVVVVHNLEDSLHAKDSTSTSWC